MNSGAETTTVDARAAAIMAEGVRWLDHGELSGALCCFDAVIWIREELPWRRSRHAAWLLAESLGCAAADGAAGP